MDWICPVDQTAPYARKPHESKRALHKSSEPPMISSFRHCFGLVIAIALSIAFLTETASAKPRSSTKYTYYAVSAKSAAGLFSQMLGSGPVVSGARAFAATYARMGYAGQLVSRSGKCRVRKFRTRLAFTIRLPRATAVKHMNPSTRKKWRQFSAFVKRHEQRHRAIWLGCARAAEARINRIRASTCAVADNKAAQIYKAEQIKCDRKHRAFDAAEQRRLKRHPFVIAAGKVRAKAIRLASPKGIGGSRDALLSR